MYSGYNRAEAIQAANQMNEKKCTFEISGQGWSSNFSDILLVEFFQKLSHLPNGVIGQDAADYATKVIKLEDELVQVDVTM